MQLTQRQKTMLEGMLESGLYDLHKMKQEFGIAERTIYNDIKVIRQWLEKNHLDISFEDSTVTAGDDEALRKARALMEAMAPHITPVNQYSRVQLVLTMLFINTPGVSLSKINASIGVSRSTFYRDFPVLKKWLEPYGLTVQISKEFGARIEGPESSLREAMVGLVLQVFEHYDVIGLFQRRKTALYLGSEKKTMLSMYLTLIDPDLVRTVALGLYSYDEAMDQAVAQHMHRHEDSFIILLTVITLIRGNMGYGLESDWQPGTMTAVEQEIIEHLLQGHPIDYREKLYLAEHYQRTRRNYYARRREGTPFDKAILTFLEEMSIKLNYLFLDYNELFENIRTHLYVSVERRNKGIEEVNPLKEQTMERFGYIFEQCKAAAVVFEPFLGAVSDDEICYLVLYLAAAMSARNRRKKVYVVCTTGKGSAELLKNMLTTRFPEIDVCGALHMQQALELKGGDADFILSTIFFPHDDIPVIRVTPLLLDEDMDKIQAMLEEQPLRNKGAPKEAQENDFFQYMMLLTDCVSIARDLSRLLGPVDNEVFISLAIHLMMGLHREDVPPEFEEEKKQLKGRDKEIFEIIAPLYIKYKKEPLAYDIRSIKTYYEMR